MTPYQVSCYGDSVNTPESDKYIAGVACELLAELSSIYDDTGSEAEAIMTQWSDKPGSAGEDAARRVLAHLRREFLQ